MERARVLARVLLLPVLGATVLAGCSDPPTYPADPVVRYDWAPGDVSMLMLLKGSLAIADGCLVVEADETEERVLVAFPRSLVKWDAATGILTYNNSTYRIGDHVSMGGGGVPLSSGVALPADCRAADVDSVFLLQTESLTF